MTDRRDIPVYVVRDGKQTEKVQGVFYFASAEPEEIERVFVFGIAEDKLQVTAYITKEKVIAELERIGYEVKPMGT